MKGPIILPISVSASKLAVTRSLASSLINDGAQSRDGGLLPRSAAIRRLGHPALLAERLGHTLVIAQRNVPHRCRFYTECVDLTLTGASAKGLCLLVEFQVLSSVERPVPVAHDLGALRMVECVCYNSFNVYLYHPVAYL